MLPALAISIVGLLIDPRIITDAPAWLEPVKVAVSIAIYVFTLAWAFTLIPGWQKTCRVSRGGTRQDKRLDVAYFN
jgi:hypothetical protein